MTNCTHSKIIPGLDACYCPDCKQSFSSGTAKHKEIISREIQNVQAHFKFPGGTDEPQFLGGILVSESGEEDIPPRNGSTSNETNGDTTCFKSPPRNDSTSTKFLGGNATDRKDEDEIPPRNQRRRKGDGTGYIYFRTVTKKGKNYYEAYYHYEMWEGSNCLMKSSKYIPKRLVAKILEMEEQKAPVREILKVLEGK